MDKSITTGLTDLGKEKTRKDYGCCCDSSSKEEPKEIKYISYPSFCVQGNEDLLKTPDGEFYAVVKLKKGEYSNHKDWEDPNKMISEVTFEIIAIKQLDVPAEKAKVAQVPKIDFSSLKAEDDTESETSDPEED
jgi:hypothetical protein